MEMNLSDTQGRGINVQAEQAHDHRVVLQCLRHTQENTRMMIVPQLSKRVNGEDLSFYMLGAFILPNPRSRYANRRRQTIFVMANLSNKWNPERGQDWNQNNPIRNSCPKMFNLMNEGAPFNSMVVTGSIGTEYVPANMQVDIRPLNAAARALFQAHAAFKPYIKSATTQNGMAAQAALKAAYTKWATLRQEMINNGQLAKSNIIFAQDDGIVLTNSIVQGMSLDSVTSLTGENLWQNPAQKLTFAPHTNLFTGFVRVTTEEFDPESPNNNQYGLQKTQNDNRQFCRKGARISNVGNTSNVRIEMYDNLPKDPNSGNTRTRAESFDNITRTNRDLVVLDARLAVHPYAEVSVEGVILPVKFTIEVGQYLTMSDGSRTSMGVDEDIMAQFANATFDAFDEEGVKMGLDVIEAVDLPIVAAEATTPQAPDLDMDMPWDTVIPKESEQPAGKKRNNKSSDKDDMEDAFN